MGQSKNGWWATSVALEGQGLCRRTVRRDWREQASRLSLRSHVLSLSVKKGMYRVRVEGRGSAFQSKALGLGLGRATGLRG